MKKQLKILVVFLMVWAPLGAQTFEKRINIPTYYNEVSQVLNSKNDDIVLFISTQQINPKPNYSFVYMPNFTTIIVLTKKGIIKKQRKIYSFDFFPSLDSSFSILYTNSGIFQNNQFLLSGDVRLDTPSVFTNITYVLDTNLSLLKIHQQDTLNGSLEAFNRLKSFNSIKYACGFRLNVNAIKGVRNGLFAKIDDSLKLHKKNFYHTSDSIYLTAINDFLIDKNKQFYFFGAGEYPIGGISDMQLVKTDSNFHLLKKKYISYPLPKNEYDYLNLGLSINSFWISDTTFLLATTGPTGMNVKGDIHLFVYDTNLNQKKYKRIISTDSTEYNDHFKTTVYDSVSQCFYMGATRSFKNWNWLAITGGGLNDTNDFQLTKFDKNLNIIFKRNYRRNKTLFFNTLTTDSKGNVIMTGAIKDVNITNPYNSDIFVLKVDSLGNLNTNTGFAETAEIDPINYRIFPNPTKGRLYFIQYNLMENYKMKLFNNFGALVGTYSFNKSDNSIDISNLSSGYYVYQLTDSKGRKASGKIVKQ